MDASVVTSHKTCLKVSLKGVETLTHWSKTVKSSRRFLRRNVNTVNFVEATQKLAEGSLSGLLSYPFSFRLAEDLPPSSLFTSQHVTALKGRI